MSRTSSVTQLRTLLHNLVGIALRALVAELNCCVIDQMMSNTCSFLVMSPCLFFLLQLCVRFSSFSYCTWQFAVCFPTCLACSLLIIWPKSLLLSDNLTWSQGNAGPLTATKRQPSDCVYVCHLSLYPTVRIKPRSTSPISSGTTGYLHTSTENRECPTAKRNIINDKWAPAGLNKRIHPGKVRGEKLYISAERRSCRNSWIPSAIKNVLDSLQGKTTPTSKREPETDWKLDKCIYDISVHFVRYWWLRLGLGWRPHDAETVCPVNTAIAVSYLITVWMSA